jgi:hypothetical protein
VNGLVCPTSPYMSSRAERPLAQPIGIALAFLSQCDNSLGDDLFCNIWLTAVAKRLASLFERGTHLERGTPSPEWHQVRIPSLEQGKGQ